MRAGNTETPQRPRAEQGEGHHHAAGEGAQPMKTQTFGIEVEMNGITRQRRRGRRRSLRHAGRAPGGTTTRASSLTAG